MLSIEGKALVFTDLHLGLKSASKSRLAICINAVKKIIQHVKENDIKTILFLGDWNHVRVSTENSVLNISYKLVQALAKQAEVYMILGNHDIYMKNSVDVNSLVVFKDIPGVHVIDKTTEFSLNGNRSVLVPWLGETNFAAETFDMMFGHFEVTRKYLIKSYVEDHSRQSAVSANVSAMLKQDDLLKGSETVTNDAGDYVGDFVEVVKKDGTVFSGHIHGHREFLAKGRKFIFVGDPYQQNLGEKEYVCGFYVINADNSYAFHELTGLPKHVDLQMSKVVQDIEKFDFSCVTGNIIHKIYDVEVDRITDAKVMQKITDRRPYEELLPDYNVAFSANSDIKMQNESIELIKKSKMDYVKNYIHNIDKSVLEEQHLDPDKLYDVLAEYYNRVTEEK